MYNHKIGIASTPEKRRGTKEQQSINVRRRAIAITCKPEIAKTWIAPDSTNARLAFGDMPRRSPRSIARLSEATS
jgi:hypothetical protein